MAASGAAVGPAAPLFEKVELRGEGELAKIQALLDEALEARLQVRGRGRQTVPAGARCGQPGALGKPS